MYDLDGTLVDSGQNIANAVNRVRQAHGLAALTLAQTVPCIGEGSVRLIEMACYGRFRSGRTPDYDVLNWNEVRFEPLYDAFLTDYQRCSTDGLCYYDGVLEALDWAQSNNIPQAILTNKPHDVAVNLIERLGIREFFTHVIGPGCDLNGEIVQPKPNTRALQAIIADNSADRQHVWMVGDGVPDVLVAAAAGISSIGIVEGMYPPGHLLAVEPPPTVLRDTFRDAFEFLQRVYSDRIGWSDKG